MPLLDLSLVTQTFIALLERRVTTGLKMLQQPAAVISGLSVSALPADKLSGEQTIGFYLYHITEDSQFKNLPPLSQDQPPARFRPMGLQMYYQLTSHSDVAGEPGASRSQMLFGLALKAMRDFPSIDSSTKVLDSSLVIPTETQLFPVPLQGTDNYFRIALQAVQPSEATHFWTGTQAMRLAAYYIVSATMLEPESQSRYAGRVLRYGVHTFISGTPQLDASRSTVIFRVPGETADREIEVQPAEAHVGGQIRFHGSELAGDDTSLLLKNARFPQPIEVGATWAVNATEDQITVIAGVKIGTSDTLPGLYSAVAKVTIRRRMPDGSIRAFGKTSNEVPFLITPTITAPPANTVATANAQGIVTLTGSVFQHPDIQPAAVKVIVGPQEVPLEPGGALTAGHFKVASPIQLSFRFPIAGLNSGDTVPYRVMINGAENAPRWVKVP